MELCGKILAYMQPKWDAFYLERSPSSVSGLHQSARIQRIVAATLRIHVFIFVLYLLWTLVAVAHLLSCALEGIMMIFLVNILALELYCTFHECP